MPEWIIYIVVFLAVFLMDMVWTLYIRSLAQGKIIKAASLSALVYSISALSFVEIVKDTYLLIPATLGAFLGTYFTMKWDIKHEKNKINSSTKQ
jgi:hypothetical protein